MTYKLSAIVFGVALCASTVRGQHAEMPAGMTREQHLAQLQHDEDVKRRGAAAMGFDQDTVAHHFLLSAHGGSIVVDVRDRADAKNLAAIRVHLRQISGQFADGNFGAPYATHGEVPPGVPVLQQLKSV